MFPYNGNVIILIDYIIFFRGVGVFTTTNRVVSIAGRQEKEEGQEEEGAVLEKWSDSTGFPESPTMRTNHHGAALCLCLHLRIKCR